MSKGTRIAFIAKGRAELESFEGPHAEPGKLLLRTECTLISPGTERANLLDMTDYRGWPKYLGYSAVATVLDTGNNETSLKPGDRVAVYHSIHASHLLKQECDLVRIEDPALPAEEAVFSIVAAMGLQGLRKVRPELGESVMVMGQGLLGIFALQCARLSGAFPLIAFDFNPARRKLALELGADYAFSPDEPELEKRIMELTRGGVNAVVEVTGAPTRLNSVSAVWLRWEESRSRAVPALRLPNWIFTMRSTSRESPLSEHITSPARNRTAGRDTGRCATTWPCFCAVFPPDASRRVH